MASGKINAKSAFTHMDVLRLETLRCERDGIHRRPVVPRGGKIN